MVTQRSYRKLLIVLAFVLLPLSAMGADKLFETTYKGEYSGWNLELVRTLSQDGEQFHFRSESSNLFASIEESSDFTVANHHLSPLSYQYYTKVFGRKSIESIDFDWDKSIGHFRRSNRKRSNKDHTIEQGMLDPSIYQLQLQADVANGLEKLSYRFVKRRKIERYEFQRIGKETFKFNDKAFDAVVLLREDPDDKKTTKIWLLPDLHYQIARIHHHDSDGDTFEIELEDYKAFAPAKIQQFFNRLKQPQTPQK